MAKSSRNQFTKHTESANRERLKNGEFIGLMVPVGARQKVLVPASGGFPAGFVAGTQMLTIRDCPFSAEYIRRLQTAPVETQG